MADFEESGASGADLSLPASQNLKFEREDWTSFRTPEGLQQKAGVPKSRLRQLVLKELVDNATTRWPGDSDLRFDGIMDHAPGSGLIRRQQQSGRRDRRRGSCVCGRCQSMSGRQTAPAGTVAHTLDKISISQPFVTHINVSRVLQWGVFRLRQ
jgi:hypothetical protein